MRVLKIFSQFTWEILQTFVGWIIVKIYKAELYEEKDCCQVYYSSKMPGGISLGRYIIINEPFIWLDGNVENHEYGHCRQSRFLGPMYLPVVGVCSGLNAIFGFTEYYYDFWTERWADKLGGVNRQ